MQDPKGIDFYDAGSGRNMIFVQQGEAKGWLVFKHPDGQWVTLRKATVDDVAKLNIEASKHLHPPVDECPRCDGKGWLLGDDSYGCLAKCDCDECKGSGKVVPHIEVVCAAKGGA